MLTPPPSLLLFPLPPPLPPPPPLAPPPLSSKMRKFGPRKRLRLIKVTIPQGNYDVR